MAEPGGRGPRKRELHIPYQMGGDNSAFYEQRIRNGGSVPSGYEPGQMASGIGGPDAAEAAHIDMQQVDAARVEKLRLSGAVHYQVVGEGGNPRDVYVQLGITKRVVKGGVEKEFVQVRQAAGEVFDPNTEFALDMSDAPLELRQAVVAAQARFAGEKRSLDQFSGDRRSNRETALKLGPLVAARLERDVAAAHQVADRQKTPDVVKPAKIQGAPDLKQPQSPEERAARRREVFTRAFGNKLPDNLYEAAQARGAFIVEPTPNRFAVVQIVPVGGGLRGDELKFWRVVNVIGAVPDVSKDKTYKGQLGDMPHDLRLSIERTLDVKQKAGDRDGHLELAVASRERGRAFGRAMGEQREAITKMPNVMAVGDSGKIAWERLPDGGWKVAAAVDVPFVLAHSVFKPDLSDAPLVVIQAAKGYKYTDPTTGEVIDMLPVATTLAQSTAAEAASVSTVATDQAHTEKPTATEQPAETEPALGTFANLEMTSRGLSSESKQIDAGVREKLAKIMANSAATKKPIRTESARTATVRESTDEIQADPFADGQPGATVALADGNKIRLSWRPSGGERYVVNIIAVDGKASVRQGGDYELRNLPSEIKTAVRDLIQQEKEAAAKAAEDAARKKAEETAKAVSQTGRKGKASRAA